MGEEPEGFESVDLLIDLHAAKFRRKRGPRPPAHDDAGHNAAQLSHHRNPYQVGHVDGRAESLQFHPADKSEDQPNQELISVTIASASAPQR